MSQDRYDRAPWRFGSNTQATPWMLADRATEPMLSDVNERERVVKEEEADCSWTSVHRLETMSAVWSGLLFIASIVLICIPRFRDFQLPLWWSVPQIQMQTDASNSIVSTYTQAWTALCPAHNKHAVNAVRHFPNVGSDGTTAVTVVTGTEMWETGFVPVWALAWIFLVSVLFQGARARPDIPVCSFIRNTFGYDVTAYVELLRWLEYALTSPFQLWLVCGSFFIGDFATLVSAALAQAGLVLLGGLIEYYVCTAYKKNIKYLGYTKQGQSFGLTPYGAFDSKVKSVCDKRDSFYMSSVFLLVIAWVVHVVLWIPILMSFFRLDTHLTDCTTGDTDFVKQWHDVRGIIYFIIFSQFITFSLFGVRLTWTVCFDCIETKTELYKSRVRDSKFYAVLSVIAKSLLDIGFVFFVLRMSQTPETTS